jgi:hypothetical protein
MRLTDGVYETVRAQVQTQQYASAHTASWQVIFYPVLGLVFVLNVLCLLYLIFGALLTSPSPSTSTSKTRSLPSSCQLPFPFSIPFSRQTHGSVKESSPESDNENDIDVHYNSETRRAQAARGLVTDYTEPQNLFALAVNSPPSHALAGSCGNGPNASEMVVPWRVGYAASANHYFFEGVSHGSSRKGHEATSSGVDLLSVDDGLYGNSYKRLSSSRTWF